MTEGRWVAKAWGGFAMGHHDNKISLGFSSGTFSPGVHICQIVTDDEGRQDTILKFLLSGLKDGELTSCFSDKTTGSVVADYLGEHGMSYKDVCESGALTLLGTRDIYFQEDRFDPDRMINMLAKYHEDSVDRGYSAARVIGEMTTEVQRIDGGNRLFEYESKVNLLLEKHPVTAVCQYDAREFDGGVIMDVLKVHPLMLLQGAVVHNPFYIPPEKLIKR